jgi:hypothetical protein
VKAELALGGGEDVEDGAVVGAVVRDDMAEKLGRGGVEGGRSHPGMRLIGPE